jgi:threonine synthase
MVGVQAQGASPLVTGVECDEPETVATAIRIGRPVNAPKARAAVKMSGGFFMAVSDEEILEAQSLLASREGVFAEPASCAPLAGLMRLKREGKLPEAMTIAMILTGNGLKDPDTAISKAGEPVEVDGTMEALREVIAP